MPINYGTAFGPAQDVYFGETFGPVDRAYFGLEHDPVFERQAAPRITNYGINVGSGLLARATFNRTQLPLSFTIGGTFPDDDVASWRVVRAIDGTEYMGAERTSAPFWGSFTHALQFTSDLHPTSDGWQYNLAATGSNGRIGHATALVRMVTNPTVSNFRILLGPSVLSGPGVNQQFVELGWDGSDGDPAATWTMTQITGFRRPTLPSSRHLNAARGRQTGVHAVRLQVAAGGGGSTEVRLTASNEGGSVHADLTINWLS